MDYCVSAFSKKAHEESWRSYIADGIYAISNSITNALGGIAVSKKYSELHAPKKEKKERTAKEVINHLKEGLNKLGGK